MKFRLLPIALAVTGLFSTPVFAQEESSNISSDKKVHANLDSIDVTATRRTTDATKTPASISVVTQQQLEESQASDIRGALRYEPGITVRRTAYRPVSAAGGGGRGGNEGINIRGLEGNRVLMMEDGVPLPNSFSFGSFMAGRGDYLNVDLYKRIEILRGPASNFYGSDGLTGAVNFITKDPQDLLDTFGKNTYVSWRSHYNSDNKGLTNILTAAAGNDVVQGMVLVTTTKENEVKNRGDVGGTGALRTDPNPQDIDRNGVMGKLVFKATPYSQFKFSAETLEQKTDSQALSAVGVPVIMSTAKVTGVNEHDKITRDKFTASYHFDNADSPWIQSAQLSMFYQKSNNEQSLAETRDKPAGYVRDRFNSYKDETKGISFLANSQFQNTGFSQHFTYGVDFKQSEIESYRNGNYPSMGDPLPSKAFPDTDYDQLGIFVQDEIKVGKLSVIPSVRFDQYKIDPKVNDPLLYGATDFSTSKDDAVSPRLAVMYEFSEAVIPYVQYAQGFRAPTPDEVNTNFSNLAQGYASIPNPNLKPETSETYEIGLKGKLLGDFGRVRYGVAAFWGEYDDFISREVISSASARPIIYQFRNLASAKIDGVEARADWTMKNGFTIKGSLAYAHGTTRDAEGKEIPLDTVNPFSAVLGIRYAPDERWFVQTDMIYQAAKKRDDVAEKDAYLPPSSFVVDLGAGWNINKYASLYANVTNLFDQKYWNWGDVRGVTENSRIKDAYTATGRAFNVGFKLQY